MVTKVDAEVGIVGAGMVGLVTSLLLADAGFQVCLIDEKPFTDTSLSDNFELRVSAIMPSSIALFKKLGVWDRMCELRATPFSKIKIWEGQEDNPLCFKSDGYIIENYIIQLALMEKIKTHTHIIYKAPENINNIHAQLIIGADGANSKTREKYGIDITESHYPQSATVATIRTSLPHENIARQRFLSTGPLAFLPLPDPYYCSIVWTSSENLKDISDIEFNSLLQIAFGSELGEVRVVGERLRFPLIKKHAKNYVKERVALVGDAAHTIHPLAGQGVNLGFLDAKTLSEILIKSRDEKRDIGLLHTLRKYERARKADNMLIQNAMDIFTIDWLRKFGMALTRRSDLLKDAMAVWMAERK